jgi:hypothetical protein
MASTPRPLSLAHVDFPDLYARHLCRHSQFGINVAHLAALFGLWYAVYALVYWLVPGPLPWVPVAMAAGYLAVLAPNVPLRVLAVTAVFLALFVAAVLAIPPLPSWAYLLMVPAFYKLQSWSHRIFTVEKDMTEFNKRYPKGGALFVVLLFYEVPIVLNYLVFGRKDWAA